MDLMVQKYRFGKERYIKQINDIWECQKITAEFGGKRSCQFIISIFCQKMQIHQRYQSFIFFGKTFTEAHCIMIETMSSNKTQLQLRFVLKIKDLKLCLKSKGNRINLNYVKSIKINSGRAIQHLAQAISAHASLP